MGLKGNAIEILAPTILVDLATADSDIIEQIDLATYLLIVTTTAETPAASLGVTIDAIDGAGAILKAGYIDFTGSLITAIGVNIFSFGPHANVGPAGILLAQTCVMPARWRAHLLQDGDAPSIITAKLELAQFFVAPIA